jgi:uncharacterized membrane protein HdeD (DUF308 family)
MFKDAVPVGLAWGTLVAGGIICIALGACYLLGAISGPQPLGIALLASGIFGIVGLLDLRRKLLREPPEHHTDR